MKIFFTNSVTCTGLTSVCAAQGGHWICHLSKQYSKTRQHLKNMKKNYSHDISLIAEKTYNKMRWKKKHLKLIRKKLF